MFGSRQNWRSHTRLDELLKLSGHLAHGGKLLACTLALAGVLFFAGSSSASLAQDAGLRELYGGLLEVELPTDYEEMRITEMERTFPSLPLPDYVYSDRIRTNLVAISIINNPNPDVDLLTYTATWARSLESQLEGFSWVQRKVARIEGRPWIVWQYRAVTPDLTEGTTTSETIMFMSILSKDVMVMVLGHAPQIFFNKNINLYQQAVTSLNLSIDAPQLSGLQGAVR
ncbi:MAG: hypothetical protein KI792_04550 [Alphaproteobacteria bacterium]|nr:hypothetical protein [Alphaproteobacteria bacterium SS10]